jgi:hypothetical protein
MNLTQTRNTVVLDYEAIHVSGVVTLGGEAKDMCCVAWFKNYDGSLWGSQCKYQLRSDKVVLYRAFSVPHCRISNLTSKNYTALMPVKWYWICRLFFQEDIGSRTMFPYLSLTKHSCYQKELVIIFCSLNKGLGLAVISPQLWNKWFCCTYWEWRCGKYTTGKYYCKDCDSAVQGSILGLASLRRDIKTG